MIKKHLSPLTMIFAIIVMAIVFACTLPEVKKIPPQNTTIKPPVVFVPQTDTVVKIPKFSLADLEFANEVLPMGDERVDKKMKTILASFSYKKLQTNRLHQKAAIWFPIIEPILMAYGIPNDFKYLPLVESGLRGGTSPKGAVGYWQFMPSTARNYGLKVNSRVDERKNLKKSTIAACRYIKELYRIFDSWALAAAAYNVGDVHMQRQIKRQSEDNYFKLKLNRETGGYVYKLMAMKEILENPKRNGYREQKPLLAFSGNGENDME